MDNLAVDILAFAPMDTANLEILRPGGVEGTGWIITFAGPSHPQTIAFGNEVSQKSLRRQRQIETAQINGKKFKPEDRDVDDVRRENIGYLVERIVTWTPVRLGPGDPIAFERKAATEILLRPDMAWVTTQMSEFLADERSFTKASATEPDASQSDTSNS